MNKDELKKLVNNTIDKVSESLSQASSAVSNTVDDVKTKSQLLPRVKELLGMEAAHCDDPEELVIYRRCIDSLINVKQLVNVISTLNYYFGDPDNQDLIKQGLDIFKKSVKTTLIVNQHHDFKVVAADVFGVFKELSQADLNKQTSDATVTDVNDLVHSVESKLDSLSDSDLATIQKQLKQQLKSAVESGDIDVK